MGHILLPSFIGFAVVFISLELIVSALVKNITFANFPLLPFIKCPTTLSAYECVSGCKKCQFFEFYVITK